MLGAKEPLPEVVQVPEPVDEVPFNVTVELLAQTVCVIPAVTVGGEEKITSTVSLTKLQPPLLVDVRMRFTKPAVVSAVLGV